MKLAQLLKLTFLCQFAVSGSALASTDEVVAGPPFHFLFQDVRIPADGRACVDVVVENFMQIEAFEFGLSYDNTNFSFESITSNSLDQETLGGFENFSNEMPVVTIIYTNFFGGQSLPDGTVAFSICFNAIGEVGSSSIIEITNLANGNPSTIFSDGIGYTIPDFNLVPGTLTVKEPCAPSTIDGLEFEIGTTWVYNGNEFSLNRDTLIDGEIWYGMSELTFCARDLQHSWLRKEEDVIWVFHPAGEITSVLYDFCKVAGESCVIQMPAPLPIHKVIVDSVGIEIIDGIEIGVQYVSTDPYMSAYDFNLPIYRGIGSAQYFFPTGNLCDFGAGDLICFSNMEEQIEFQPEFNCITTSVGDRILSPDIVLTPNPSEGTFFVSGIDAYRSLSIYNVNGILVERYDNNSFEVKISEQGLFFVKIDIDDGVVVSRKVMVQ